MSTLIKLIFIVFALMAGYFAQDLATWLSQDDKKPLSQYCSLSTQGCQKADIIVKLDRDVAQPLVAVNISADWPDSPSTTLRLTLNGYEMDMGTALFELKANDEGIFQAEVLLPSCTMNNMTWVGQLSDGQQSINLAIRMIR